MIKVAIKYKVSTAMKAIHRLTSPSSTADVQTYNIAMQAERRRYAAGQQLLTDAFGRKGNVVNNVV